MKCEKCGADLREDSICPNCEVTKNDVIAEEKKEDKDVTLESVEQQKSKDNFLVKNKKLFIIIGVVIVFIFLAVLLYSLLFGFVKLEWDDKYKSIDLDYVIQSKVKLGFDISDRDKMEDVKINVSCGSYEINKREITWNLIESKGQCKIELSYKLRKLKKEFTVITPSVETEELVLDYEIDMDSDEDLDYDGLTNKQEKEYGTNPVLADSDMDGLDDYYEIFTSKTDPMKVDTDDDGLNDYDEIELGMDPLKSDSKEDGIKDGERKLTYTYNSDKLSLSVTGKGNIASTVSEISSGTKISGKEGLIDNLYTLYTAGDMEEATLTIKYTMEELEKNGLKEDNLSIYYYNEKESKYERIDSEIDKVNKTVTAKLKHFSNYVLGDATKVKETNTNQVLFVLDNSWSMYTNEQYEKYTGKSYSGGIFGNSVLDGFDAEGLRFTLTSELVSSLTSKDYEIGLSEFRNDYKNAYSIGSSAKDIKSKLSKMEGNFITNTEGTNIEAALTGGMEEFSKDSDNKYIIILTDGQDSNLKSKTSKIIENANNKDIKICSIGFGGGTYNVELANISNATGCKFFSSSDSDGLKELFDNLETELSNDLIDIDDDGESDGILIADSGFIASRDGFSFKNYVSNYTSGHCYGMATFAELYYLNKLPLNVSAIKNGKEVSHAYDLRNTYFKNQSASLYDYKLKTNELKYYFGYDYFGEEVPENYKFVKDDVFTWSKEYRKLIDDSNIYDIKKSKTGLTSEQQLEKYGVTYKESESLSIREDEIQKSKLINNEDKQLFNAIYAAFIKQNSIYHVSSSMNTILYIRDFINKENFSYSGETKFINILKTRLASGDPVVINSDFSGGLHAINAISLVQDVDNPNYYYIGVYDNNYPGEKRYVDLECKNDKCVTKANKYYSKSNEPVRMTVSLEYDLDYYKEYIN